jgi:hypothetical protein
MKQDGSCWIASGATQSCAAVADSETGGRRAESGNSRHPPAGSHLQVSPPSWLLLAECSQCTVHRLLVVLFIGLPSSRAAQHGCHHSAFIASSVAAETVPHDA